MSISDFYVCCICKEEISGKYLANVQTMSVCCMKPKCIIKYKERLRELAEKQKKRMSQIICHESQKEDALKIMGAKDDNKNLN